MCWYSACRLKMLMPIGFLQTDGSPGGASGPAAAAVAGRWAVCGCELQSAANLLHPADAPPSSRRWWHTHCQVSRAELKTHLIELFHSRFVSEDLEQCFFLFQVWDRSGRCCGQSGSLLSDRHSGSTARRWADQEAALGSVTNIPLLLLNLVFC